MMSLKKTQVESAVETGDYLCNLISGVPFHSQEDFRKDLWHIDTVLSVPPQKVFLLLSDFRQRISVAHLAQLIIVAVSQGVVTCQPVTL